MTSCVFCDIIAGKLRASVIFEDEDGIVFADVRTAGQRGAPFVPARDCAAIAYRKQQVRVVEEIACGGHDPTEVRGPLWVSAAGLTTTRGAPAALATREGARSYAVAYGLTADPAIAMVTLRLADGDTASVPVQDDAFLIVVVGEVAPVHISATNVHGELLYEQQLP